MAHFCGQGVLSNETETEPEQWHLGIEYFLWLVSDKKRGLWLVKFQDPASTPRVSRNEEISLELFITEDLAHTSHSSFIINK